MAMTAVGLAASGAVAQQTFTKLEKLLKEALPTKNNGSFKDPVQMCNAFLAIASIACAVAYFALQAYVAAVMFATTTIVCFYSLYKFSKYIPEHMFEIILKDTRDLVTRVKELFNDLVKINETLERTMKVEKELSVQMHQISVDDHKKWEENHRKLEGSVDTIRVFNENWHKVETAVDVLALHYEDKEKTQTSTAQFKAQAEALKREVKEMSKHLKERVETDEANLKMCKQLLKENKALVLELEKATQDMEKAHKAFETNAARLDPLAKTAKKGTKFVDSVVTAVTGTAKKVKEKADYDAARFASLRVNIKQLTEEMKNAFGDRESFIRFVGIRLKDLNLLSEDDRKLFINKLQQPITTS